MFPYHRVRRLCDSVVPCLIVTCIVTCSCSDAASSDPASIRDAQLRFVKIYVDGLRSRDAQKVVQTYHPAYRACISPANKSFIDQDIARQMGSVPSSDYKVTSIKPADPDHSLGATFLPAEAAAGFPYPAKPVSVIQVDFEPSNDGTSLYSIILEVAPDRGSWYWVGPCPNAKGLEFIQKQMQEGERQKAEARKRVAELKDPLLSELKQLLQAHDKIGAIKKYSKETGADMTTAVQVINELEPAVGH